MHRVHEDDSLVFGRIFCGKPVSIPDRGRGQAFPENALADLGERRLMPCQGLGAPVGHDDRLAAQQIAGLRQVLVRVDHEHHAGLEDRVVVERDVAGVIRATVEELQPQIPSSTAIEVDLQSEVGAASATGLARPRASSKSWRPRPPATSSVRSQRQ